MANVNMLTLRTFYFLAMTIGGSALSMAQLPPDGTLNGGRGVDVSVPAESIRIWQRTDRSR